LALSLSCAYGREAETSVELLISLQHSGSSPACAIPVASSDPVDVASSKGFIEYRPGNGTIEPREFL
jgi:hypothetical protein